MTFLGEIAALDNKDFVLRWYNEYANPERHIALSRMI